MKSGKELTLRKKPAAIVLQNWRSTSSVLLQTQQAANVHLVTWGLFTQVSVANWGSRRSGRRPWWGWTSSACIKRLACFTLAVNGNFTGITLSSPGQQDDSDQDQPDISDSDDQDPLDFDQLSAHLIEGAASANIDRDVGDGDDSDSDELPVSAAPLRITIPPLNSTTLSDAHRAPVKKTSIPLKILFKYPTATDLPLDESGMNSFWKGGIQNLEKEMEAYELLTRSLDRKSVV